MISIGHGSGRSRKSSTPSLVIFSTQTRLFARHPPKRPQSSCFEYRALDLQPSRGASLQACTVHLPQPNRMSLPTYEASLKGPDKLTFVAPYLGRLSLLAASLVCKEWHAVFTAELWSDPIKLTAQTLRPFGKCIVIFLELANPLCSQDEPFLHTFEYACRRSSELCSHPGLSATQTVLDKF